MKVIMALFMLGSLSASLAQRSPYAGRAPVGYPAMDPVTTTTQAPVTDALGNRFGASIPTTTQRLPIEANGDADLVRRLLQLPPEHQPFWLLNWQALERDRNTPHSYPVRQNGFLDFASSPNRRYYSEPESIY